MAYSIDTYSGSRTVIVDEGTIDNTLDIKLIGKNYAGYGEVQNENFVYLLENFAGPTAPSRPLTGQLWYDSSAQKIKFWDANTQRWQLAGGVEVAAEQPTGLTAGDLWWDDVNKQLYVYDSTLTPPFVLVGPNTSTTIFGKTEFQSLVVTDIAEQDHAVLVAYVSGEAMFLVSRDAEYQLSLTSKDLISKYINSNYEVIKPGITLVDTTDSTGITQTSRLFWGTASNASKLDGEPLDSFILKANPTFDNQVVLNSGTVLSDNTLVIHLVDSVPTIENTVTNTIRLSTGAGTPLVVQDNNIVPETDATSNIGLETLRYNQVHAVSFFGSGAGLTEVSADTLKLNGNYINASISAAGNGVPSTIACRDSNGNLNATLFQGTATSAMYADLAEKYLADQDYEVGTVVQVGGPAEITASTFKSKAIGVISGHPAFRMNEGLEGGTFVALKGRVPVKVLGPVAKGDCLMAAGNGCAVPTRNNCWVFGVALESNSSEQIKLVEAVIL